MPRFAWNGLLRAARTTLAVCLAAIALTGGPAAAQPATLTPVSGSGQSTIVDALFPNALRVIVQDAGGNTLPNVAVTFTAPAGAPTSTTTTIFNGAGNTITVNSDSNGAATVPAAQVRASQRSGQFTVDVSAGGASTTILLINAAGPPASIAVNQGAGQSVTVGANLAMQLVAQVVDGFSNPVAGATVIFTAPSSGASGSFSGSATATTITNASGLASAPTFTANATAGVYNVVANTSPVALATPANFNLVNLPGVPTQISVSQGSGQSTQVTTNFGTLLRALVRDASNNPVPNVSVTFTLPGSGASATFAGSVTTLTVLTDASGLATATTLTANTVAGNFSATATFSGGPTATYSLTNTPGAAASMSIQAGGNQSTTITLNFATNLAVRVADAHGNAVSGATVTFTAPGSGASGNFGGSLTRTATTNASGIATATTFTANATAGTYSVTVTFAAISISFTLTNVNPAAIVVNAGSPQSTTITLAFATALSARVTDAGGTGIAGLVVTFTAPGSGASGTFAGGLLTVTATTNASGVATAPTFTANATSGAYNVSATVTGVGAPALFALTNNNPSAIGVQAGNSQQATINTPFPTALSARVTDSGGNGIAGLVVTFTASSSGASGLFGASLTTTATTNASGVATASSLTANGTVGAHVVNATVAGVGGPAQFNLTNLTPTPVTINVSASSVVSQSTAINSAFGTALGVIVRDINGVVLTNYPVTFTVNPAGGAGGSFTVGGASTTVNTNASGIATASALTANGTAGAFTVTATAGSLTFTFNLTSLAPAAITATAGTPQTTLINTNFATQLQATVVNGVGTPISGVTVTFTAPGSGATGTFGGSATTTAVTNASGVATAAIIQANGTVGTYAVTASVAGVGGSASYSLTNTAPASIAATAGTPQTSVINTNYAVQLQATVRDASSNPVAGALVTFTAPGAGASGTFGGSAATTATTNASGIATAAVIRANAATGSFTVIATVAGVGTAAAFDLTNTLPAPATATATAGSTPQSTAVNTAFPTALGVLVRDSGSNVIVGIPVTFTVNSVAGAGATFAGGLTTTTINTAASGIATAPALTANGTAGSYTVTATVGALSLTFNLSNTAVPASITATAGDNQSATISTNFTTQLQATVRDSGGNPIAGVVVVFSAPTTGARATFAGASSTTTTTNASGVATAPAALAGTVAGAFVVTATVQGTAISTTFNLTNTPGAVSTIARVSGNAQSAALGVNFAQPLVAVVRDASGNPIPGVTVTFTAPSTGARATFPGPVAVTTVVTDSSGQATSPPLTAAGATGTYNVGARATGGPNPNVNFSLTNTAATPASVSVNGGSPQTTVVNSNFAATLQARVVDTLGNPSSGVTVTFTVPGSGASGTFSGSTTVTATTNASGIATSPTLRANTVAGTFFAQAAIVASPTPAIYTLTNTPDTPVAISIVQGTPQSTVVTSAFATSLIAQVSDIFGNAVPNATVNWLAPTIGSTAAFPGPTNAASTTTNSSGRATAPTLTANNIAGTYTVTASIPAGALVNYNLTNLAMPTSMTPSGGSTQTTPVTTPFGSPLEVIVRDNLGQPIQGITVTFAVPGSGASGTLSSTTAVTNAAGVASVTVTANANAGSYVATATVIGVATPVNFNLTNTAGSPGSITASGGNTQSTPISTAFGTPLQVTVRDGSNNPVPNVTVTYVVPGAGASAVLSSLTATTNASGVASVTATANTSIGSYAVTATAAGVATPATFNLTNTVGTPASISATGGNTQSTPVTTGFGTPLQVTVRDGSNNPVPGITVTYVVPGAGATAALSSLTATTNASGVASVTATANTTAGSYVVSASVAGVGTAATFNLTNTAGAPASITATGGNTQSTVISTAFGAALQVTVRDGSNNPVPGITVTYVVPGAGATSSLSSLTATTNAAGVASVTATANATAGSYVVSASVAGVGTAATFNLTNTAGSPGTITATGGNTQSTAIATAFGAALQVTVRDGSNNPVSGVTVTYVVPGSGATATLSSLTATTNAAGIASVTATANTTAGSYVVTASVAGVGAAAAFNLTNTAGAPASIVATGGNTQSTPVTTGFGTPLQVTVRDGSNNPVPGVTVTYVVPGAGATATLSSLTATTNAAGVASVTATANATAGSYVVSASVAGVGTAATFNLTNLPGTPAGIVATGGNTQSTLVTTAFAAALEVTVRDLSNNPVPNVTVTFTAPGSAATATLSATTATTNAAGIASVTATANANAGSYVVTASVVGIATPASFNLTNTGTPGLMLTVGASAMNIAGPGQTITFSYVVRNTGNLSVTGVLVTDQKVTGISCPATTLAVNATMTCTATYVTTAADVVAGGVTSVAESTGATTGGPAISNVVTTRLIIDVEAIRRATIAANRGLMESRAQVLASMAPNAQRLHQRLSTSIFGGGGSDDDGDHGGAPTDGRRHDRHDPLKFGQPMGAPAAIGGGGMFSRSMPTASSLTGSIFSQAGMPMTTERAGMIHDEMRAGAKLPFAFGGSMDEGAGRFNFAGSLSQMRAAIEADDMAKLASAPGAVAPQRRQREDVFDLWVEGHSASFKTDRTDGRRQGQAAVIYAGADIVVAPGVLVGVVFQKDWIKETSTTIGQNRDGAGWMAGPYVGLRLTKNLFFDAFYTRGSATNNVDPIGAYIDTFTSMRELITARLTGDWRYGNWRFRPSVEGRYYTDTQKAYVNQIGISIPETRLTLGTMNFGPEIGYRIQFRDTSVLEPYIGIKGVWDFARDREVSATGTTAPRDVFRGRIEAGASYRTPQGVTLRATGAYDGLGSTSYQAWQGQAFVIVPIR